jgi:cytoskeletal protein CcmA (bactofilin family)
MWNRKKEDDLPPQRTQPAVSPAPAQTQQPQLAQQPPKEGSNTPMSSMPQRFDTAPAPKGGSATIGKAVMVKGQIFSREDLVIDGEVEGTVELQEHKLTVEANGKVNASVKAREIVVVGSIHGDVEASDRIEIQKDAKLVGDIKAARIAIQDGAYFKGSIDIVKPEPAKQPAAAPQVKVQQAQPATAGASQSK